jgi:2-C-methyl-D-erythritol 4-phosphate cytidylyltransferase
MAVDLAAIVPLPATFADNAGAAFAPLAGTAPLARVAQTMLGAAVVAVAEPLADAVRETLAAQGLSAIDVAVARIRARGRNAWPPGCSTSQTGRATS